MGEDARVVGRFASPFLAVASLVSCQTAGDLEWGAEAELYPAGVVVAGSGASPISENAVVFGRAGYNFTDRRDYGDHEDESGGGPGFGFGYRRWFGEERRGWFWGARADLWFLEIDWEDAGGTRSGTSDVIVLQPVGQGGYTWPVGDWRLDLSASLGAEINVDTSGEDVGEGAILLLGVTWAR